MNIYPENFEEKINFEVIRSFIKEKCLSPLGEEKVVAMQFSTSYETIKTMLLQTHEFVQIIQQKEEFPICHFLDIQSALKDIEREPTAWLSEKEIPFLADSLSTIVSIVDFLNRNDHYLELNKLASEVQLFPTLIEKAIGILDTSGQIKDNASKLLLNIRRQKAEASKDVTRSMQAAIRNAQDQGFIGRDVQADMRGSHYLIPVTAANKRKIKGVVRDSSGSGKTFFIEPEAVVEATNRLRDLENEERKEMARILIEFTQFLRPDIKAILGCYSFMGSIDFIRAKALFAIRINGVMPEFENKQNIQWLHAKHPLLDITLRQENKEAQPLDIRLTNEDRILIVSGVNAGGKSLCLKTVALLQYMLQCGLLIPVRENSKAGIFRHIFMDIGDGQSLINSLSTYTAHLTNMKFFVENNDSETLLLIDEFGGGTEPQIGGAIAETLLERFNSKKSFGLITTHFQNLKYFAFNTDGIINGAMLYDSENNRPMYKLLIGTPGSSFAIEVARRIGLSETIISEASKKIGEDFMHMDRFLQSIAKDKLFWETKSKELHSDLEKLENWNSQNEDTTLTANEITVDEKIAIKIGDRVSIQGQNAVGTVVQVLSNQAVVAFGSIKSKVALHRLILK